MQVAFRIVVNDNQDITTLIADRLLSLEITDQAGVKSDRLTLVIDDRDQRLGIPQTGAKLEASLGYVGAPLVKMGSYVVDEVEVSGPAREMTIRANAADMNTGIKSPKERSWHNKTLGDIVRTIAGEHRLQPAISAALAARQLGHVDQTESDMQLLQRLCADQGATCKVADGRLTVAERATGKAASGADLPEAVITASQCASWSATLANRGNYKTVKAYWQNTGTAQRVAVTAGSGDPVLTLKNSYASQDEAKRAAESKLKSLQRGTGKMSISGLIGDPYMSAERTAALAGFRGGIDGSGWVVNSVTHTFSGSGYTCDLEIDLPNGLAFSRGAPTMQAKVVVEEAVEPKPVEVVTVDKDKVRAELDSVNKAWNAELDKSLAKVDEARAYRLQADSATSSEEKIRLLKLSQAALDESQAIEDAANAKYQARYNELKAMLAE